MGRNIFHSWGFQETPFETKPLPPNLKGLNLLVGREKELRKIRQRLETSTNVITIEGNNGVGKTSLVNIAAYQAFKDFLETGEGLFFMPCDVAFQLTPQKSMEDFVDEVLMAVAQTLLRRRDDLEECGYKLEGIKAIDNWLNAPQISTYTATMMNLGIGKQSETNTSMGYQRSGFRVTVLDWLRSIFPYGQNGGVVCVIDNLELLQSSDVARKQLEQLRDTLFSYDGLRWVLCGSTGIVYGVASSPRLEGRLQDPIDIEGIERRFAPEILNTRVKMAAFDPNDTYLPLGPKEFEHLYNVLNGNIRNTLNYAQKYCFWIVDQDLIPSSNEEKINLYYEWLEMYSTKQLAVIKLNTRAMETFRAGIDRFGGSFSPSDYEEFGFNTISAMRPHISTLEKAGFVTSCREEGDKRRKTIQVTPRGWFLNYGLNFKQLAKSTSK